MPYEPYIMLDSKRLRLGLVTILDAWRLLPQRQRRSGSAWRKHLAQTAEGRDAQKPRFRKYLAQLDFDERIENEEKGRTHERFRLYLRKKQPVGNEPSEKTGPSPLLRFNSVRELTSEASAEAQSHSRTFIWLSHFAFNGTVVPTHLSQPDFPAADVSGFLTPHPPRIKRTDEDKKRVEAIVRTPIPPLAEYITPEITDMLKKSPFNKSGEDVLVVQHHGHRTRGQNMKECFYKLSRLLRNVASEIVYREQRIAADENMYRDEGTYDDPETVILSEAESKAMAWNLRRPFNQQLRRLRKQKSKQLDYQKPENENENGV